MHQVGRVHTLHCTPISSFSSRIKQQAFLYLRIAAHHTPVCCFLSALTDKVMLITKVMHDLCWSAISGWLMGQHRSSTPHKWVACWPQWADRPGGYCLRLPAYHALSRPLPNPDKYIQIINRACFNLIISHHHWRDTVAHRNTLWCYCSDWSTVMCNPKVHFCQTPKLKKKSVLVVRLLNSSGSIWLCKACWCPLWLATLIFLSPRLGWPVVGHVSGASSGWWFCCALAGPSALP